MSQEPKPKPYPPRILTSEEAARLIGENGKNRESLRRWRKKDEGPPFIEIGKIAYYRSDLLEMPYPVQGKVDAFPVSWEEQQTLNELLLMRLLLLQVVDNWKEGEGYRLTLDGESKSFRSKMEVTSYLNALNKAIFAIEAERLSHEPSSEMERGRERELSRESVSGNRVLAILNRLVETSSPSASAVQRD